MTYSLIEIFGQLPVDPLTFKKLDPKLKWLENPVEGNCFCVSCGTLTPHSLKTHHPNCILYNPDMDEWIPTKNSIGICPACGSEDGLNLSSSWELQTSTISCIDCRYVFSDSVDEETLIEKFKELNFDN